MLVARLIGQQMVARDTRPNGSAGGASSAACSPRPALLHGHRRDRHRRHLCRAAAPRRSGSIDIGFIVAFALQGAIWARELILGLIGRRVGDGTTARPRSATRWRSSGCWSASPCSRSRSSSSSTISESTSPRWSPASASAASPSALPRRASSPTCSRRWRSCSTSRSARATRSASTRASARSSGSASRPRGCAR